jgi:hypothetical protein
MDGDEIFFADQGAESLEEELPEVSRGVNKNAIVDAEETSDVDTDAGSRGPVATTPSMLLEDRSLVTSLPFIFFAISSGR